MYSAFQATPDAAPYSALQARVPLDERNDRRAWGAEASRRLNLAEADLAPDRELNEIIWRSVRGAASAMPPIVRSAFVRTRTDSDLQEDR